ncbi:unnamed protein product [Pleuronectes platessa]|uniref:Uncharacterized protein n=1 Tax=Pleuronectes platessa TaxID=8262 RepID=A0A9N7UC24_PLEPL|nr:unnamed protein product [Pleuronectes platessa]
MCDVQLLWVSVHERISAAAEDFLLQVEKGGETAQVSVLRAMLTERLAVSAEEIVSLFGRAANSHASAIAHRSRGSAPRPAHSLRDTRPELLHVKELSAAPINDFGPQRPPECSEQHGYNAKFQQFPDI